MNARLRQWWPVCKVVLALVILAAVGWHFARILQDPRVQELDPEHRPAWQIFQETLRHARPEWLIASALLYLGGLSFFLTFWLLLLRALGQPPRLLPAVRAYFLSHLGKYVPGKAWALLLRATLSPAAGVPVSVGAVSAVYETLTTMAAGALVAAVLLSWQFATAGQHQVWLALGLLAVAGVPILPGIFNPLVRRLAAPFLKGGALPRLGHRTLLEGLLIGMAGWSLLGLSLWALLQAVLPEPTPLTVDAWARWTALTALAYVAGFLLLLVPGGLGVREAVLQLSLQREAGVGELLSLVVALLLRLVWTVAELLVAAILWRLPVPAPRALSVSSQEPAPAPCEEGLPP
jgi:uncharacterized membrane protein YbhN (UPF0104 family)